MSLLAIGIVAIAAAGCFDPQLGTVRCGLLGQCPPAETCNVESGLCESVDVRGSDPDGDGIEGTSDNCPLAANPGQYDEDADGVGNPCDNCPATSNPAQENSLEDVPDQLGDACDPNPETSGDSLLFFSGFDGPLSVDWNASDGWFVADGELVSPDSTRRSATIAFDFEFATIATDMIIDTTASGFDVSEFGLQAGATLCGENIALGSGSAGLFEINPSLGSAGVETIAVPAAQAGTRRTASLSRDDRLATCSVERETVTALRPFATSLGVMTSGASVRFAFLAVYARVPGAPREFVR